MKKNFKISIVALLIFSAYVFALGNANSANTTAYKASTSNIKAVSTSKNINKTVILGGDTFGIKLFTDGVMVIKIDKVDTSEGTKTPAKNANIEINDIIVKINNDNVTSNEQLGQAIAKSNGDEIDLTIKRNNQTFDTKLVPCSDKDGVFRAGMWVRDSSAGIGTITYYDTENKYFAALGHGICDTDTGCLMPLSHGETVKATITSVTKGQIGTAGGLNGYFNTENLGNILFNTNSGLYSTLDTSDITGKEIEIANKEEVTTGDGYIATTIDSNGVKLYSVKIQAVSKNDGDENTKNLVIKITDKELLNATGGIVQGMSGSPIIQNGKLVGAVTHVFINKPDTGYGIFAQNMLENFEEKKTILYDDVA